ncbi:MAG: TIGR01906 family membrane protein [Firmicutes bacterium]|nr:TIGR01906 family membrane protein [Bacillota bacterium]
MLRFMGQVVFSIGLLLLALLVAVQWVAYDANFITRELVKLGTGQRLGLSLEEIAKYSAHTSRYLRGLESDPNVKLKLAGGERWFLNEREVLHMQDVQGLFFLAKRVASLLLIVLAIVAIFYYRADKLEHFYGQLLTGAIGALLLGLLLAFTISRDFNQSFTLFHHLSFDNDLWLLDPATDLLIRLLPEVFFANAALQIGLRGAGLCLTLAASSYFLKSKRVGF